MQPSEFEELLQEVCSQGMQQVQMARHDHPLTHSHFFQADLEKLLLEFCKLHWICCGFSAHTMHIQICGRLRNARRQFSSKLVDAPAGAGSCSH
jgi:hypothetical protein